MFLADHFVELLAMAALMAASGFFSCSEAALFSLSRAQRAGMGQGTEAQRRAAVLLSQPERLLTAILFWNLVINMAYFALASIVALRVGAGGAAWASQAFALGALLAIIVLSELTPKNVGVLRPRQMSALLGPLLAASSKALQPLLPTLERIGEASVRLLWPNMENEPYLGIDDLERAVELGAGETHEDELLLFQERLVLHRVVDLANAPVEELMQPRRRCTVLTPPASLDDLREVKLGEYVLFTESDSDEIASATPSSQLAMIEGERIDRRAEPVVYLPWCSSCADALSLLRSESRRVAAVVNELGETVGIVTIERLLDSVLRDSSRVDPADAHAPRLRPLGGGAWEASGAMPLRTLAKKLGAIEGAEGEAFQQSAEALKAMRSVTVGGLLQEVLQRYPTVGDRVLHLGIAWTVVSGPATGDESASTETPLVVSIEPDPQSKSAPQPKGDAT